MQLSEFNKLALMNENQAKNFISLLIGHLNSHHADKAIIQLYEELPEDYKKNKENFSNVMLKYFTTFKITDFNIKYFYEYSKLWNNANLEKIKKLNPDFSFNKSEFKNSLEFVKALSLYEFNYKNKDFKLAINFVKEHEEQIEKLVKKNKKSFVDNMQKKDIWQTWIKYEFNFFKEFCNKYDINEKELLNNNFFNSTLRPYNNFDIKKSFNIEPIIEEIIKNNSNDEYWEGRKDFLLPRRKRTEKKSFNVFELVLELIKSNENVLAMEVIHAFEYEMNNIVTDILDYQKDNGYQLNLKEEKFFKENFNIELKKINVEEEISIKKENTWNRILLALMDGSFSHYYNWTKSFSGFESDADATAPYIKEIKNFTDSILVIEEKEKLEKDLKEVSPKKINIHKV